MPRYETQRWVRRRTRFQRFRDAKLFTGWVVAFADRDLVVRTSASTTVEIGDKFRFEVYAQRVAAVFEAHLRKVGEAHCVEEENDSPMKTLRARWVPLHFEVVGELRCQTSSEPMRVCTDDMRASVRVGEDSHTAAIVDLAPGGVGLLLPIEVPTNAKMSLEIPLEEGPFHAVGAVRYARRWDEDPSLFRTGVKFERVDRVDFPRWLRLFET